ncbi:MAG: hypothetical protein LC114_17680 [Bryobacterales bacterium]|nr:hypothetical protein [Bryobacterales bacterium]
MKLGAEPEKVAILAVLLVVAGVSAWVNFRGDEVQMARPQRQAAVPSQPRVLSPVVDHDAATEAPRGGLVRGTRGSTADQRLGEFRPVFKSERRGEVLNLSKIDPTLRTDLLAKLDEVRLRGTGRNLFQFGSAPPPPRPPEPKIIPKPLGTVAAGANGETAPAASVKPPPPAIPLRYFGYADPRHPSETRAFFMEGEEIRIAGVGELIKQRYRVLEIGPKSAVVEDTQFDNRQTLVIQPESGS